MATINKVRNYVTVQLTYSLSESILEHLIHTYTQRKKLLTFLQLSLKYNLNIFFYNNLPFIDGNTSDSFYFTRTAHRHTSPCTSLHML